MKIAIIFCLVAVAAAAPGVQEPIPIVSHDAAVDHDGKFHYSFETGHGIKAEQHGELKVIDKDHAGVVAQGRFVYQGDDGQTYELKYTADEFGYHPEGAHLPVAPPVPEAIQRALAYIAAHPPKDEKKF